MAGHVCRSDKDKWSVTPYHRGCIYMDVSTGSSGGKKYVLVWDCETDSGFSNLPGETHEDKIKFMQFTCICALAMPVEMIMREDSIDDILSSSTRYVWWRDVSESGSNPIVTLLKLFDNADLIVGYNCLGFDFPLIRRFYTPSKLNQDLLSPAQRYVNHRSKTMDVMARIRDATGNYYKLDYILKTNAISCKSSNGKEAIKMWEEGRRDDLQFYCATDVVVTAKLAMLDSVRVGEHLKLTAGVIGIRRELLANSPGNSFSR